MSDTKIGYIQLTRICNHKCIFCSNPQNGRILSLNEIEKKLYMLKEKKYTDVIFTGGEPTLHPQITAAIKLARKIGLVPRIITNGSKLSQIDFLKQLIDSGLSLIHLSVYTYDKELNDKIRGYNGAFKQMVKTLVYTYKLHFPVQITTVIFKQNQKHLFKNILFIKKLNPNVNHFVWNILDPLMMPKSIYSLNSIPDLNNITDELINCFSYLEKLGDSFRIERIPLCKIPGYEYVNTECRKLVKNEERVVFFLDKRDYFHQKTCEFRYDYHPECQNCTLYKICPGIYKKDTFYKNVKVNPIYSKHTYEHIVKKIRD